MPSEILISIFLPAVLPTTKLQPDVDKLAGVLGVKQRQETR
jgi:hypothetical protein